MTYFVLFKIQIACTILTDMESDAVKELHITTDVQQISSAVASHEASRPCVITPSKLNLLIVKLVILKYNLKVFSAILPYYMEMLYGEDV